MADNEQAKAGKLPRIGELIDKATGVKYESYSGDQTLGRTEQKPYNGMEAAAAFEISHPDLAGTANALLKQQATLRSDAVAHDMAEQLNGKTLSGLKPVPMVNGKVQVGALFMSDLPTRADVIAQDMEKKATPEKLASDLDKLTKLQGVLKDPNWLVAEGASNVSNAIRDAEINMNGHSLTGKQAKTMRKGLAAEQDLESHLANGEPVSWLKRWREERQVLKAMDTAAEAGGIQKDDPVYQHYREGMKQGIHSGLKAIGKELHSAGVQPTGTHASNYTPAAKTESNGKSR